MILTNLLFLRISTYQEGFGADDDKREFNENNLVTLVASKLSGIKDWSSTASQSPRDWPMARKLAILDTVLYLNYHPLQVDAKTAQADMIASHMRTAFSVPKNRSYVHSGYPSEPILAEAALRICDDIEEVNEREIDLFATILQGESVMGSIESEQRGENVAKILLIRAYMAAVRAQRNEAPGFGSFGGETVPLKLFLENLFSDNYSKAVLQCRPDNVSRDTSITPEKAFEHAKVRFDHFVKLGDDTGMTTSMAWVAFIRCMALIGWSSQGRVDIMIPVLLYDEKIAEWVMSGILIQIKRRIHHGSMARYAIDERDVAFFPPEGINRDNRAGIDFGKLKFDPAIRPYITLVMELGVTLPGQSKSTNHLAARQINHAMKTSRTPDPTDTPKPPSTPSRLIFPQGASRFRSRNPIKTIHPRYSIFAYGCSDSVYKVIREEDRDMYQQLVQTGELIRQHSRLKMLPAVRSMKPFWVCGEDCYAWVDDPFLRGSLGSTVHEEIAFQGVETGDIFDEEVIGEEEEK